MESPRATSPRMVSKLDKSYFFDSSAIALVSKSYCKPPYKTAVLALPSSPPDLIFNNSRAEDSLTKR